MEPAPSSRRRLESLSQREERLARQRGYNSRRRRADTPAHEPGIEDEATVPRETEEHRQQRLARQREYGRRQRARRAAASLTGNSAHARHQEYNDRRRRADTPAHDVTMDGEAPIPRETEEHRQERLARQREYGRDQRARRTGVGRLIENVPQQHVSGVRQDEEMEEGRHPKGQRQVPHFDLRDAGGLSPVSPDVIRKIEERLQAALGADGLDECVCAVCDRLVLRRTSRRIHSGFSELFESMRCALRVPVNNLPPGLLAQYCCDDINDSFVGMMLSPRGVLLNATPVSINMCEDCHSSLLKGDGKPPRFAIANGFYVGILPPHLFDSTWIEKVMTQLVTVVAQTRVMRGGRHRSIRSHCMVFDATPGPPATLLPRRIDRAGPYRVVLAGPMTPQQTDRVRKLHHARGEMVGELLRFFKTHNVLYADVEVDNLSINEIDCDTSVFDRILIVHDDPSASSAIDNEQDSISRHIEDDAMAGVDEECSIVERNVLLAQTEAAGDPRVVDLNAQEPFAIPRVRVDHSSRFASRSNIDAKMYPHLFPFGRGHPDEPRTTPVSKLDCIRHYALLSSRRFAQDPTFLLTSFARLSLENMYTLMSVKCRRNGSMFEGYEGLSRDELATALMDNERRQRGEARQELPSLHAARFLKSVELGSVSVWGSSAERRQCRQDAFGFQTRFGQPSLFVTITPNTDNSYAMAHYAGILSVDTLFDALEARIPTTVEMKKAAMMDDCASARLFMRTVDAFITHVLGINPKTSQSTDEGGVFGRTKAYFGMVETQGRGTLHIHFLVWLFGAPVNSHSFDENVRQCGDSYTRRLETYVDSIVTSQLPLPIDQVRCQRCQKRGCFVPLSIPSSTRRERSKRKTEDPAEPLLVNCENCGAKCSAQHILRQGLMLSRPPHWPPPLSQLSESEVTERVQREIPARSSAAEAAARHAEREMYFASLIPSDLDVDAEWALRMSDSTQLPYTHADNDPLKYDSMNRLIEMTPPTLDAFRMSANHYSYMLSSLVVNLNTHAWTHTGSCFKKSRATKSASLCRYGFPRERCDSSSISGTSVKIKRRLAHEFVNGFNPTIMTMFKCNHDVQVIFGGKDAINRIYYCCKYVTKPQRQIDSTTAVALASFQRRQAKEAAEAATEAPPSLSDVRRRRVTSMIHTFTNKQEIAGPLAALYILRGSCCYSSATCVKLPLSDVLKQLESSGEYGCALVETRSNDDTVFAPASHLDNYIYRPESTSEYSLYEFTMQCYRRQINGTVSATHLFKDRHPLSLSHCVAFRRSEAVPVISGPRLPRLKESMDAEEQEEYARLALVLFKPFREWIDLLGSHRAEASPWSAAYNEWEGSRSEFIKTIMQNMNDFHAARAAESDAAEVIEEEDAESTHDSECGSFDDGYSSEDYLETGEDTDTSQLLSMLEGIFDGDQELQVFPTPHGYPERIQKVLANFDQHKLVEDIAREVAISHQAMAANDTASASVVELKRWVEDDGSDSRDAAPGDDAAPTSVSTVGDVPTRVNEIIDASLMPEAMSWEPMPTSTPAAIEASMFSGVAALSRLFTLNKLQHGAFAIVATHLLRRWRSISSDDIGVAISDQSLEGRQLRMFLGGEGGTGKSRVIQAIQELCRCWQRSSATVVSALTGKAASIINGRTLASFEMSLKRPSSHVVLQDVDCLIVDEVSMMSKAQLLRLDRLLRKAKRIHGVPFGGIHVILVGDFLQLPPVGADPIFIDPSDKQQVSLEDFEGFHLWRRFDKIVVLRDSVRFKDDPEWGEGCSHARYGEWTPTFMAMINSRLVGSSGDNSIPSGTVFVTPDNETRTAINGHFMARAGGKLPAVDYPVRVIANFKGALNKLSAVDVKYVMGLADTRFGRMAPFLDLMRGMPIQITQNVRTRKGVANGTMGILHSVTFPDDTSFRHALDKRTGAIVLIPDKRPSYALVEVNRGSDAVPIAEGVDPRLFPVFPETEAFSKAIIGLTPSATGEPRSLSVKIQQFPFVCAVGATVYKVQGESLKSMVVVDWKADQRGANRPQQAYLMVSRVVTRHALVCLKPFTREVAEWAKPPANAIAEDRRLAQESQRTLSRFYEEQLNPTK